MTYKNVILKSLEVQMFPRFSSNLKTNFEFWNRFVNKYTVQTDVNVNFRIQGYLKGVSLCVVEYQL